MPRKRKAAPAAADGTTASYQHAQEATQRLYVGVQDQFRARKPPKTYCYRSRLDPTLSWDENRDRDLAEWLIRLVQRCATEGDTACLASRRCGQAAGSRCSH